MKYKIVTFGKTKEVALAEISHNLKPSSEVYELSEVEIYLGPVSHNTLAFFLVEFAEYALKNYEKERIPEAEICISLIRKWIRDDTSVSKEELKAAADAAYYVGKYREKEFERQGTFIIDFLKTGKNLFLV